MKYDDTNDYLFIKSDTNLMFVGTSRFECTKPDIKLKNNNCTNTFLLKTFFLVSKETK